jgi:hypothetical protein
MFDLTTKIDSDNSASPVILKPLARMPCGLHRVAKQKPRQSYRKQRTKKARTDNFRAAVSFAYEMDWPIYVCITITWSALIAAGEHNEGNCLGKSASERDTYLRREIARLARREGLPFVAIWGRDVGAVMGSHVHLGLFWPHYRLQPLLELIERITGSSPEYIKPAYEDQHVARSVCGGWQVDMNRRGKAGAVDWSDYVSQQEDKHHRTPALPGKAYGVSEAIGKKARDAARAHLEARVAWMPVWAPTNALTSIYGPHTLSEGQ